MARDNDALPFNLDIINIDTTHCPTPPPRELLLDASDQLWQGELQAGVVADPGWTKRSEYIAPTWSGNNGTLTQLRAQNARVLQRYYTTLTTIRPGCSSVTVKGNVQGDMVLVVAGQSIYCGQPTKIECTDGFPTKLSSTLFPNGNSAVHDIGAKVNLTQDHFPVCVLFCLVCLENLDRRSFSAFFVSDLKQFHTLSATNLNLII